MMRQSSPAGQWARHAGMKNGHGMQLGLAAACGVGAGPAVEDTEMNVDRANGELGQEEGEELEHCSKNLACLEFQPTDPTAGKFKYLDVTEASSLSFGAPASYGAGLWSVNASVNHSQSEAHAEAMSELPNAAVKISFECMRVDIGRAWLRPELFYDEDLVLGPSGPHVLGGMKRYGPFSASASGSYSKSKTEALTVL
ncbi:hypothetical protein B0H10DRAFT_1961122 [Mycena sp. CBHHK59/15]|nr:hypothetical protein B0H10DRAFT_1961122 [Mycena sp. CBHHK59/15]